MRIFVDNSSYSLCNMGDLAMLQVGVERLRALWPDAQIDVLAGNAQTLARHCPDAHFIPGAGRNQFLRPGALIGPLHRKFPCLEAKMRFSAPRLSLNLIQLRKRLRRGDSQSLRLYWDALSSADLVICTGGGFVTDAFATHGRMTLENMALAKKLGKSVAMLGQGIGPATQPALVDSLRRYLPMLDWLSLREKPVGEPLLHSLGFPAAKTLVTGDDAIEFAFRHRSAELGQNVGFNVRVTNYSGLDREMAQALVAPARNLAAQHGSQVLPVPISRYGSASDVAYLQELLGNGGDELDTPGAVASQVALCRLVVTGSYHAGVFALSQGVPVVAISNSPYYDAKFEGLKAQFGGGVTLVRTGEKDWANSYQQTLNTSWDAAPQQRESLLEAARRQIELSKEAYAKLPTLLAQNGTKTA
ncbi:MAG TPA: polysaccharide pyruvyl transferase family protein [Abditibacterium sp.]|jgi:colanic acid/amylovoran biosynthesis protein